MTAKQKRSLIVVLIGLLAISAIYVACWGYVAGQLKLGVERWAVEQRAIGNQVDFTWTGIEGFPFFRAEFRNPALQLRFPGAELTWRGSDLTAEISPWNLREIRIASAGEHNLWLQAQEQQGQWRLATLGFAGVVDLYRGGALQEITAELEQPDATLPGGLAIAAGHARLGLSLPEVPPANYQQPFADVTLDVSQVALPKGTRLLTAEPITHAAIDATIMGPLAAPLSLALDQSQPQPPQSPPSVTVILSAWRDAGGDLEVESFAFAQGPLSLSGEATLALDGNLQPLGAGTVTASGLAETVEILLRDGLIPADRAMVARATAKALERTGADGKAEAKFALSLQNGALSFGPAPLLQVPPIEWP